MSLAGVVARGLSSPNFVNGLNVLDPFVRVAVRIYVGMVFWYAGLNKLANWRDTLYAFSYQQQKSHFSPLVSLYGATLVELLCPILLVVGLGARFAALALVVLSTTLYQVHTANAAWLLFLLLIAAQGAGRFSYDCYLYQRWLKSPVEEEDGLYRNLAVVILILLNVLAIGEVVRSLLPLIL